MNFAYDHDSHEHKMDLNLMRLLSILCSQHDAHQTVKKKATSFRLSLTFISGKNVDCAEPPQK